MAAVGVARVLGEAKGAETRSIDIEALTWFTFVAGGVEDQRLQDAASDWLRLNRRPRLVAPAPQYAPFRSIIARAAHDGASR